LTHSPAVPLGFSPKKMIDRRGRRVTRRRGTDPSAILRVLRGSFLTTGFRTIDGVRALFALLFFLLAGPAAAQTVPFELACGVEEKAGVGPEDAPFDPARGWGYIAGEARSHGPGAARGGDERWPLAWREGVRQYSFRLPNGEYLVRLTFIETETAAPGARVFDVLAGEAVLARSVDIAGEAGDFAWLTREGLATVRSGWLDLRFHPAPGSLPPRISRIRVDHAAVVPPLPGEPRGFAVEPGPLQVGLRWDPPAVPGIAGYGIFRAAAPDGPFESLTDLPIAVPFWIDERRPPGLEAFYRVRAYGLRGGQSPLSPVLSAKAGTAPAQGLQLADLRVEPSDIGRLFTRADPPVTVNGLLRFLGADHEVEVSCLTDSGRWQARKSFRILAAPGARRGLRGRREIHLLAQAGDPTLLREKLAAESDRALKLATPETNFVHLLINGRYQGVYLDRETLSGTFRQRSGIDRYGKMAYVPGRLRFGVDPEPYGRNRGQGGDLQGLTRFVHELNRLNESDLDGYFAEKLYLDRVIDRLAAAAIRGVDPFVEGSRPPSYFLEDSRNGKWEFFWGERGGGDFGIEDAPREFPADPDTARVERALCALLGWRVDGHMFSDPEWRNWRVLETRLLSRPAIEKRYLARIEEIARTVLTPEWLEASIASARAPLVPIFFPEGDGPGKASRGLGWLPDGSAAFREGPERIKEFDRSHRATLLRRVKEGETSGGGLVVNETCFAPQTRSGENAGEPPWVELLNRSDKAVDLPDFLTLDLDRPRSHLLPNGVRLAPGERAVLVFRARDRGAGAVMALPPSARRIEVPLEPSAYGGELGLFDSSNKFYVEVVDRLFWGRQSEGFSQARIPDGGPDWAFVATPTPGAPNAGKPATPPPWEWRSGLEVESSGARKLWFRINDWNEPGSTVHAILRGETSAASERIELAYQKEGFRHELPIGDELLSRLGRRIAYYFVARTAEGLERAYPLPGPAAPLWISDPPPVSINELLPRPLRTGPHREFVELFNASDAPVSVDGLFLSDDRRNSTKFRIEAKDPIPPRGFLVIQTDGRGEGTHANFRLGNAGEYLGLFHRAEEGNVLIDQVAFPAVPPDRSYGRERDGQKGFKVWKDPTPGARNIPKIPAGALDGKPPAEPPVPEPRPEDDEPDDEDDDP